MKENDKRIQRLNKIRQHKQDLISQMYREDIIVNELFDYSLIN